MSTTVKSLSSSKTIDITPHDNGTTMWIDTTDPETALVICVGVDRADFLAAVAKECGVVIVPADAIVIERGELPDVTPGGDGLLILDGGMVKPIRRLRADQHRRLALEHLSAAAHLDAHPPVDEAQVSALTGAIDRLTTGVDYFDAGNAADLARALVLAGVRIEAK